VHADRQQEQERAAIVRERADGLLWVVGCRLSLWACVAVVVPEEDEAKQSQDRGRGGRTGRAVVAGLSRAVVEGGEAAKETP
jgi:hypothetical protein